MECWFWCVFQCVDACIDVVKEVFDVELLAPLLVEDVSAIWADVAHERKRRAAVGTLSEVAVLLGYTEVFAADCCLCIGVLPGYDGRVRRWRQVVGFFGFLRHRRCGSRYNCFTP